MDPGNWATDIAGGAGYEYNLLFIVLASSLTAVLLQFLSLKRVVLGNRRGLTRTLQNGYCHGV